MKINRWAIISILIVAGLGLGLNAVFPALFAAPYSNFTVSILVAVVGSVAGVCGARARFYSFPCGWWA